MEVLANYVAFYNDQRIEFKAASLYAAKQAAIKQFGLKYGSAKARLVSVVYADAPVNCGSL